VLVNLGREDTLDADGLRRLVSSISRYLGDPDPYVGDGHGPAGLLRVTSSRSLGGVWLLDGLWHQLGIDTALRTLLGPRRFTTDVERVLFAPVANRALDPCSKLAATEWVAREVAISGLDAMRTIRRTGRWTCWRRPTPPPRCRRRCSSRWPTCSTSRSTCCCSTPSTYFERDTPDVGDDGELGFRRYGHSKDHRPDLPQVIIGLAVTREFIPVRVWCWPGNTSDVTSARGPRRDAGLETRPER
jgi:hypothetical protein